MLEESETVFVAPLIAERLGVALLLGGLIGLDREWRDRPAGLRTHILVSLAAAIRSTRVRNSAASGACPQLAFACSFAVCG